MIFLLHIALFVSSPALSPVLCKFRLHASFHLVFGRPLFLFPGISALITFLSMCSPSLFITCPYQINLLSVIFLEACATLVVPRMCSFLILSLRVTPHIHRSILISVTSIRFSCLFVVAHVSAPYSIAGLITVLYTFPYIIILLKSIFLSVVVHSLQAAVLARSSREMSQTVRIGCRSFLSRVRISVWS